MDYMTKRLLLWFILLPVFISCSTPTTLRKKHVAGINSVAIAVNVMLTHDESGFTDSVDVPLSKELASTLQNQIAQLLISKGYQVTERFISVGKMTDDEEYYVIETEADRNRPINELPIKSGLLYSRHLVSQQLQAIHKAVLKNRDAPPLTAMGFNSDVTLVALLEGRTIGDNKAIGAIIANIAIFTVQVLAAAGGASGGSSSGMQVDDDYKMHLRLFASSDGDVLWKTDFEVDSLEQTVSRNFQEIDARIPHK